MKKVRFGVKRIMCMAVIMAFVFGLLTACDGKKAAETVKDVPPVNEAQEQKAPEVKTDETPTEAPVETPVNDTASLADAEPVNSQETASNDEPEGNGMSEFIKKVQGASDDSGIYSFIITLSDKAADKGTLEYIYHGTKGSAHENEIVNTFVAEYFKETAGTYDITTYYDGMINTHVKGKSEVKVDNTFGALVRAGDVTVYYTPDGGEKTEIYHAEAEEFMPKSK